MTHAFAPADRPLVTLVTPTFNQAEYLAETMESVLAQTYPAIEYLVIDDGSTDNTRDVLARYDGRVTWRTQSNAGQVRTLNESWDQARGDYIGYLSSDDTLRPEAVARLVAYLEASPGAACAFPDADLIDSTSTIVRRRVCRPFDLAATLVEQECYIGPGALFRRSSYEAVGGWRTDLKLAPDREFWVRLARTGLIDFLPEVLAGYRIHSESISYKVVSEVASLEYIKVLDDYFAAGADPAVESRRDEAYGRAHFLIARNCYRGRDFARGHYHYAIARRLHPPLGSVSSRLVIARTVMSKPIRAGIARLRRLVSK